MAIQMREKTFATVWAVEDKGNYVNGRISTSDKRQDGTKDWSNWSTRFVGKCKDLALTLEENTLIVILGGKVSNTSYTNKDGEKRSFLSAVIFDFEISEMNNTNKSSAPVSNLPQEEENPDSLPF